MSLEVQIHEVDAHLQIKAMGQYSLTNLRALIGRVREESEKRAEWGVVLDVTEVAGTVPVVDLHLLGRLCSSLWKLVFRIAIIAPEGGLNKFFEYIARQGGAQVAVVPSQGTAIEWLRRSANCSMHLSEARTANGKEDPAKRH
jgi:hypothetical protein